MNLDDKKIEELLLKEIKERISFYIQRHESYHEDYFERELKYEFQRAFAIVIKDSPVFMEAINTKLKELITEEFLQQTIQEILYRILEKPIIDAIKNILCNIQFK